MDIQYNSICVVANPLNMQTKSLSTYLRKILLVFHLARERETEREKEGETATGSQAKRNQGKRDGGYMMEFIMRWSLANALCYFGK